mgnify:CR=1 FL=1
MSLNMRYQNKTKEQLLDDLSQYEDKIQELKNK